MPWSGSLNGQSFSDDNSYKLKRVGNFLIVCPKCLYETKPSNRACLGTCLWTYSHLGLAPRLVQWVLVCLGYPCWSSLSCLPFSHCLRWYNEAWRAAAATVTLLGQKEFYYILRVKTTRSDERVNTRYERKGGNKKSLQFESGQLQDTMSWDSEQERKSATGEKDQEPRSGNMRCDRPGRQANGDLKEAAACTWLWSSAGRRGLETLRNEVTQVVRTGSPRTEPQRWEMRKNKKRGLSNSSQGGVRKAGDHGVLNVKRILWEGARRWLCNAED